MGCGWFCRAFTRDSISCSLDPRLCVLERCDDTSLLAVSMANGIRKEKRLPSLTCESTRSCPPSCSTMRATTARPKPNGRSISVRSKEMFQIEEYLALYPGSMALTLGSPLARTRGRCSRACRMTCRSRCPRR